MTEEEIAKKREKEQETVLKMIRIYCRGQKHINKPASRDELCPSCQELAEYAKARVAHCPHMAEKTFCSYCTTHCYNKQMQPRIRAAMRYAGPRMLLVEPIGALRHAFLMIRFKRQQRKLNLKMT